MRPAPSCPGCAAARYGFTLIEMLIVLALMAVLVLLAVPSYEQFLQRAHRSQAISGLLQTAACQERLRAGTGDYDLARCRPRDGARYRFTYGPWRRTDRGFAVIAQPTGAQARDPCGALVYTSLGQRLARGKDASPERCWAGR